MSGIITAIVAPSYSGLYPEIWTQDLQNSNPAC